MRKCWGYQSELKYKNNYLKIVKEYFSNIINYKWMDRN